MSSLVPSRGTEFVNASCLVVLARVRDVEDKERTESLDAMKYADAIVACLLEGWLELGGTLGAASLTITARGRAWLKRASETLSANERLVLRKIADGWSVREAVGVRLVGDYADLARGLVVKGYALELEVPAHVGAHFRATDAGLARVEDRR